MALRRLPSTSYPFVRRDLTWPGVGPLTGVSGEMVTLTLSNPAGTAVAGPTSATPSGDDWTATLTMPATVGLYDLVWAITYAGETAYEQESVVVSPFLAQRGETLRDLRQRLGDETGDMRLLRASAAIPGTPSTFTDASLIGGATAFRSATLYVNRGHASNVGQERFVTAFSPTTRTLTFDPVLAAPIAVGDEAELWNRNGLGWTPTEVHRAINAAIGDAAALGGLPVVVQLTSAFVADTGSIALPLGIDAVHEVRYLDTGTSWLPIPYAEGALAGGWSASGYDGLLEIEGGSRWSADGATLRVTGTGRPDRLAAEDDRTTVNPEWLVFQALAKLMNMGKHRDPDRERMVGYYQRLADDRKHSAAPTRPAGSVPVR